MWGSATITDNELLGKQEQLVVWLAERSPAIVCLCGSTRFWKTFQEVGLRETLAGKIVLSIGAATASDADHGITPEVKRRLDRLHLHKIDLASEVLILNVDGYIGESTVAELEYARRKGNKKISFLEEDVEDPVIRKYGRPGIEKPEVE